MWLEASYRDRLEARQMIGQTLYFNERCRTDKGTFVIKSGGWT